MTALEGIVGKEGSVRKGRLGRAGNSREGIVGMEGSGRKSRDGRVG